MSREIKFRGYHEKAGMFSAETMDIDELTLTTKGQFINVNGISQELSVRYPKDKFIPMQFIGLQDKNGVDIYEKDIISDHNGVGEVEYNDKYAGFRVNYKNGQCKWLYDYNLRGERESIEVIGNFYENKDLL